MSMICIARDTLLKLLSLGLFFGGAINQAHAYVEPPPWQEETNITLPPLPEEKNLIPFVSSATETHQFFIDSASLSVDKDRVVRYVLVSRSPQGAQNIVYEGLRCETKSVKRYAFAIKDMQKKYHWMKNQLIQWEEIEFKAGNNPHLTLYKEYFCPSKTAIFNKEEGLDVLKRGGDR